MQEKKYEIIWPVDALKIRLDKAITMSLDYSRSKIQNAIELGQALINNVIITDASFKVKPGDIININIEKYEKPINLIPSNVALDIIYEDDDLIIINKEAGMCTHPGFGNYEDTLVNALISRTNLSNIGDGERPGIVHRLDKDTSGLMVVAKNDYAHQHLANQIETRIIVRKYKALIWGVMNPLSGTIVKNIGRSPLNRTRMCTLDVGGKHAITHYNTDDIFYSGAISMVECKLETGRTHQIRVHLSNSKHSIVGDQTYGHNSRKILQSTNILQQKLENFKRQALHSFYIQFIHPTKNNIMEFNSNLPNDIVAIIS
jgi:23S rRNA pseudouridine1911/1915/1917 synthase